GRRSSAIAGIASSHESSAREPVRRPRVRMPVSPLAVGILRSTLGAFLLIAAATKLLDYSDARATLAAHLGFRRARRLTPVLIGLEAGVAALLFGRPVAMAATLAGGVLCLGVTAFTAHLARSGDRSLSCGCFGPAI